MFLREDSVQLWLFLSSNSSSEYADMALSFHLEASNKQKDSTTISLLRFILKQLLLNGWLERVITLIISLVLARNVETSL